MVSVRHRHLSKAEVKSATSTHTMGLALGQTLIPDKELAELVGCSHLAVLSGGLHEVNRTAAMVEMAMGYKHEVCISWHLCLSSFILERVWKLGVLEPWVNIDDSFNVVLLERDLEEGVAEPHKFRVSHHCLLLSVYHSISLVVILKIICSH